MICPFCQHDESQIFRTEDYESYRLRGRFCVKCKRLYETIEKPTGNAYNKKSEYTSEIRQFDIFNQKDI